MKISTLLLGICLLSLQASAEKNQGQIEQIKPGFYQLTYSNQVIEIYFNYLPTHGLENVFIEPDLEEQEKYEIVKILKNQIDELPESFITEFLNIDIFPLTIRNQNEYGYIFDDQLVIDVNKIRDGMSYTNSIQSSLLHEIAHMIEENPKTLVASRNLETYLNSLYYSYDFQNEEPGTNIYQQGFVSKYASGELLDQYSASEEFAELFAHLIGKENRNELMNYLENESESILSIKLYRFIDFLDTNLPSLGEAYIFDKPQVNDIPVFELDGESLLASHELRSYESYDFEATLENDDPDEPFLANREENFSTEDEPFNNWEQVDKENEYPTYEDENTSDTYISPYQRQYPTNQKTKKRKKKNGTGLLITGAALYVLLQLLK